MPRVQELRGPVASRCGRWTRVPIDAKARKTQAAPSNPLLER